MARYRGFRGQVTPIGLGQVGYKTRIGEPQLCRYKEYLPGTRIIAGWTEGVPFCPEPIDLTKWRPMQPRRFPVPTVEPAPAPVIVPEVQPPVPAPVPAKISPPEWLQEPPPLVEPGEPYLPTPTPVVSPGLQMPSAAELQRIKEQLKEQAAFRGELEARQYAPDGDGIAPTLEQRAAATEAARRVVDIGEPAPGIVPEVEAAPNWGPLLLAGALIFLMQG